MFVSLDMLFVYLFVCIIMKWDRDKQMIYARPWQTSPGHLSQLTIQLLLLLSQMPLGQMANLGAQIPVVYIFLAILATMPSQC